MCSEQVRDGDVLLIQHEKTKGFIHSIETHASSMTDIRFSSKSLSSDAIKDGASFSVVSLHGARDEDAFKVFGVPRSEVDDTLLLASYQNPLKMFVSIFQAQWQSSDTTVDDTNEDQLQLQFDREETVVCFRKVEQVLAELLHFSTESTLVHAHQHRSRQNLFRIHQYIDLLLDMMKAPFKRYGGPFTIDEVSSYNCNQSHSSSKADLEDPDESNRDLDGDLDIYASKSPSRKVKLTGYSQANLESSILPEARRHSRSGSALSSKDDIRAAAMQCLNRILPSINHLLVNIFYQNRTNELYMVKRAMPTLMELLGNGFEASLPLFFLLRENRNLVESIAGYASIIRHFFELIKTRGKSVRYMQFLVAFCTSRGRGIPKTQEAICDLLFNPEHGYRDDAIVPIRARDDGLEIYVSKLSNAVQNNLNRLAEGVSDNHSDVVSVDSKWMPLSKFYEDFYVSGKNRALGKYCYGLLRLYVSLCLDRNYVSIDYIQTAFPREILLKAAMDEALPRSLRAVFMDLIRVAFVDCEPQKTITCPNYTRIWTEVGSPASDSLPKYPNDGQSKQAKMFLVELKTFFTSYFERINGRIFIEETPENELTLAILRLCAKLVQFGIYETEQDLAILVPRLADLMDERLDLRCSYSESERKGKRQLPHLKERSSQENHLERSNAKDYFTRIPWRNSATAFIQGRAQQRVLNERNEPISKHGAAFTTQTTSTPNPIGENLNSPYRVKVASRQYSTESPIWENAEPRVPYMSLMNERGNGQLKPYQTMRTASPRLKSKKSVVSVRKATRLATSHFSGQYGSTEFEFEDIEEEPVEFSRHQMNTVNRVVMEIKDEICAILLQVDNMRIDFQISTVLANFRYRHGDPRSDSPTRRRQQETFAPRSGHSVGDLSLPQYVGPGVGGASAATFQSFTIELPSVMHSSDKISPLAKYLFNKKSLECKFSLSYLAKRNVPTVFMQMLMYEYPPLVSKALQLLLQQFNQHDQLLKAMSNVQLLISEETIRIYNKLKDDVDNLRRLSETTEVWMDLTSKSDFEKADATCALLKSLIGVMEQKGISTRSSEVISEKSSGNIMDPTQQSDGPGTRGIETKGVGELNPIFVGTQNRAYAPRFVIEKSPPNRKLRHLTNRYKLNQSLGRVSCYSGCHDVFLISTQGAAESKKPALNASSNTAPDDKAIATEARRLLRNLKSAQYVLNMMTDGAHFFDAHVDQQKDPSNASATSLSASPTSRVKEMLQSRQKDQIKVVFSHSIQFLCSFCENSIENQLLLAPHVTMIAQYIGNLEIAQELLVAIYAENYHLYKMIPTDLVNTFVTRLIENGPNPRYLFFLETIVLCNEVPIMENQLLVLFQLVKSLETSSVLQYFDDQTKTFSLFDSLLRRYTVVIDGKLEEGSIFNSPSSPVNLVDAGEAFFQDTKMLEYHVRLLHLFAACATGKNTRVQEICQQILPLSNVLDLLSHKDCTEGLQIALLRFVNQVFLVAEEVETPNDEILARVLQCVSYTCETNVRKYLKVIQTEDFNRHARMSLYKGKVSHENLQNLKAPLQSPTLYAIICSIIPTIVLFIRQFPLLCDTRSEAQESMVKVYQSLVLLFTVSAVKDWALEEQAVATIEDLVYLLDKIIDMGSYENSTIVMSLEKTWIASIARDQRLDISQLPLELKLCGILQYAVNKCASEFMEDKHLTNATGAGGQKNEIAATSNKSNLTGTSKTNPQGGSDVIGAALPDMLQIVQPLVLGKTSAGKNNGSPDSRVGQYTDKISSASNSGTRPSFENRPIYKYNGSLGRKGIQPMPNQSVRRLQPPGMRGRMSIVNAFFSTNGAETRTNNYQPQGTGQILIHQQHFSEFDQFLHSLRGNSRVHASMRDELNQMVQSILAVEHSLMEQFEPQVHFTNVCLTFDQVVAKLVAHVGAFQDSSYVKMNLTLLDVFCRMIYAAETIEQRHQMQSKLNNLGVTKLVVQLIASRENDALFASSIELGVAMLNGMNAEVQESFYTYWLDPTYHYFFEHIQSHIDKASKAIQGGHKDYLSTHSGEATSWSHGTSDNAELQRGMSWPPSRLASNELYQPVTGSSDSVKQLGWVTTSIFRLLQLLCEGHYLNAQRFLISQPHVIASVNLVESTTTFLLGTYLALTDLDLRLVIQLFETITEFCQGPCVEAQETVANFKFISVVNALMMQSFDEAKTVSTDLVRQLRASVVITLLSVLEGRSDNMIHWQLIQELNFDAMKSNLVDAYTHFLRVHGKYAGNMRCNNDSYLTMGFNIYILLQQLADRNPHAATWIPAAALDQASEQSEPSMPRYGGDLSGNYREAFMFFQSNCARIEVVWDLDRSLQANNARRMKGDTKTHTSTSANSMIHAAGEDLANGSSGENPGGVLIPFYFPLHPTCFCLTEQSKKKLVWQVSRGANKHHDFFSRCDKLVDEMAHQSILQRHPYIYIFTKQSDRLKKASFLLAVLINLVVLLFYRADGVDSYPYASRYTTLIIHEDIGPQRSVFIDVALSVAGSIQINLCSLILACYLINSAPLMIKKGWKRRKKSDQNRRSKENANTKRRTNEVEGRQSFKDTEKLLRALRKREEEYNYSFLPNFSMNMRSRASTNQSNESVVPSLYSEKTLECSKSVGTASSSWEKISTFATSGIQKFRSVRVHSDHGLFYHLRSIGISLFFLARNPRVLYFLWQILIAVLGSYINKLYFAFHLLDVINRYQDLNNVLRSIVYPARVLGLTVLLYLVVVYVFSIIGFYFFREDYNPSADLTDAQREGREPYQCQRLFQCFLISFDQGFKNNGGLGGYLKAHTLGVSAYSYARLAFDQMYNIILLIMLLNIVFGVIIDTFASLRTGDTNTLTDMQSRCFICSIDAYTFDRATKHGFHDHIYMEHNMWHYLYLFVHVRKKPITEYNGLELYLAIRMAKKDVSFFPNHRALSLERASDGSNFEFMDGDGNVPHRSSGDHERGHATSSHLSTNSRGDHRRKSVIEHKGQSSDNSPALSTIRPMRHHSRSSTMFSNGSASAYFDRATANKIDRLEASIDSLLAMQMQMKQDQQRAEERQTELMDLLRLMQQPVQQPLDLQQRSSLRQRNPAPRVFSFDDAV